MTLFVTSRDLRRLFWLCASLSLGCAGGDSLRKQRIASAHYRLGADYLAKKMPQQARAELVRALQLDPDNQDANHLLGVVFFLEGIHALNYIDRSQCLQGDAAAEQLRTANDLLRQSETYLARAVELSRRAGATDSEGLNYLANVALHFKRYDEATRLCSAALDNILYTSQHLALCNRGWARFGKGDLAGAAADLRQALFHQPEFCLARFRLGKVYFEQRDFARAATELELVVKLKDCPIQESVHLLGLSYLRQNQREEARHQFERCVEMNPRSCLSQDCRRYLKLI